LWPFGDFLNLDKKMMRRYFLVGLATIPGKTQDKDKIFLNITLKRH